MSALLAAIPAPPFSEFHLGPLTVRMYGIMIGLGVLAATWLCGKLMAERNVGDTDDAAAIAVWGVIFGVIGARLYHVVTDFQYFRDNLIEIPMVWKPGLGIPGGILFGAIAGAIVAKRRGISVLAALSCAAPAIPLAQSIGRWGNYFNQELYGRPTTLPWGLKVDEAYQVSPAGPDVLYHPTFLYESLWNLGLCLVLVWIFRNVKLQPGRLFPLYMIGYGLGRLWIEALRIDPANTIGPFRVNIWMSLLLIVGGVTWFILSRHSTARWPRPATVEGSTDDDPAHADGETTDSGRDETGRDRAATGKADEKPSEDPTDADDQDARRESVGQSVSAARTEQHDVAEEAVSTREPATKAAASAETTKQRTTQERTTKQEAAKKVAAEGAAGKKSVAKKGAAKVAASERAATETTSKKAAAKKSTTKAAAKKSSSDTATEQAAAKKAPARKTAAKQTSAKKSTAKRAASSADQVDEIVDIVTVEEVDGEVISVEETIIDTEKATGRRRPTKRTKPTRRHRDA